MPKHDNLWVTTKWCDLEERERFLEEEEEEEKNYQTKTMANKKIADKSAW